MSASLLAELGYPEEEEPKPKRGRVTPPPSPEFGNSPDYYPSESSSPQPVTPYREELEETKADLTVAEAQVTHVTKNLEDLRVRFSRVHQRVIYLEGELAVYRRFAVITNHTKSVPDQRPVQFLGYAYPPPPPLPRRA